MDHSAEHHEHVTPRAPGHVGTREEVVTNLDRPPLLSWGAIFGGVVFLIGASWLLHLLGLAMGVSVADATDGAAIGEGLSIGAIVWIILSALIAYFVGSLLTARLSGKVDSTVGMLHGLTLWGVGTTLILFLSYLGVSSLLQTGYQLVDATASAATSAVSTTVSGVASGAQAAGSMAATAADTRVADNIKARLKRRAASVVARSEAQGGANVTQEEARSAIESLDSQTLQQIATHIALGELTAARETLADSTELSNDEVREIVEGIENEFEEQLGVENNDEALVGDIANALERQTADYVADLDAAGGASVTQQNVRRALEQLDPQTLQTVAMRLMRGDTQAAKDTLTANTSLSMRQINDIVEGVSSDVTRTVERYREEVEDVVEAASTYTQAVLWTVFLASAMGLAVSLLGGWLGADSSRRLYVETHQRAA